MHELSIAMNIVEICTEEASKAGAIKVTAVEVEIGEISGVIPEALEFSWDVATRETSLEQAELVIIRKDAIARCLDCGREFIMEDMLSPCPSCKNFGNEILQGKELKIKAITID